MTKLKYYLRYIFWIPGAFLREFAYRFWRLREGMHWRDNHGKLFGPNMTFEEYERWFLK